MIGINWETRFIDVELRVELGRPTTGIVAPQLFATLRAD
jgi:hypothetical protein